MQANGEESLPPTKLDLDIYENSIAIISAVVNGCLLLLLPAPLARAVDSAESRAQCAAASGRRSLHHGNRNLEDPGLLRFHYSCALLSDRILPQANGSCGDQRELAGCEMEDAVHRRHGDP